MSIAILANATVLRFGISTRLIATGGTEPYTYDMSPAGIGGTIDQDGVYTAPTAVGTDTVIVRDSVGNLAFQPIIVGSYLHLLADIIQTEMNLADDRVYIYNQKINMPTDSGLFIAISSISEKPFSNNMYFDGDNQVQSMNFNAMVQIDFISTGPDALYRKEEVLLALKSVYAEQQQDMNSFHIGSIPSAFTNLSLVDGMAIPYRFSITVPIQYQVKKVTPAEYFDTFDSPDVITNS